MNANLSSNIFYGDSSYALQLEGLKDKKSNQSKKIYITIGILTGIVIITTLVLLIVFLSRKSKNTHKIARTNGANIQSMELVIEGNQEYNKGRNLQNNRRYVQIFGDSFNELNSSNAYIILIKKIFFIIIYN